MIGDSGAHSLGRARTLFAGALLLLLLLLLCSRQARADKVRIIEDPREASQIRVDLIQQAKRSIDGQYYIVGDDYFTYAGLALLRDAARRGCKVRVIIDGRSNKISPAVHAHLKQEKIAIKIYHPVTLRRLSWAVRRMHDKGLDIDGKRMIRGGRNVEGDYFGYAKRNFIDRDVYVEGKAVADSSAYFDELWNSDEVVPVKVKDPTGAQARGRSAGFWTQPARNLAQARLRGSIPERIGARELAKLAGFSFSMILSAEKVWKLESVPAW